MAHIERRFKVLSVQNSACAEDCSKRLGENYSITAVIYEIFQQEEKNCSLLMTDELHFYLNGLVNKQNFRYWRVENPRNINEKELHP